MSTAGLRQVSNFEAALAAATRAEIAVIGVLPATPPPDGMQAWANAWDPDTWPGPLTFRFDGPPATEAWTRQLAHCPPGLLGAVQSALETRASAE